MSNRNKENKVTEPKIIDEEGKTPEEQKENFVKRVFNSAKAFANHPTTKKVVKFIGEALVAVASFGAGYYYATRNTDSESDDSVEPADFVNTQTDTNSDED